MNFWELVLAVIVGHFGFWASVFIMGTFVKSFKVTFFRPTARSPT